MKDITLTMTSSAQLRKLFLDYFRDHGHEVKVFSAHDPSEFERLVRPVRLGPL